MSLVRPCSFSMTYLIAFAGGSIAFKSSVFNASENNKRPLVISPLQTPTASLRKIYSTHHTSTSKAYLYHL